MKETSYRNAGGRDARTPTSQSLLVKKRYSEREQATSNCTSDHRYDKKAFSPKGMKAVNEVIASAQPPHAARA